jgi:ComF family protein
VRKLVQALLFPEACVLCDQWVVNADLSPLCYKCLNSLEPVRPPTCEICGIPVPGDVLGQFPMCSNCRAGDAGFDLARSWGLYEGDLRRVIREFKFRNRRRLAVPLAGLLGQSSQCFEQAFQFILPVPSHRDRIKSRGFDQIRVLAKLLSRETGVPIFDGLSRIRSTKPQFGLPLRERSRNVKGAFQLEKPGFLEDRRILILDDIITTGATVREISRVLRSRAGPRWIGVLSVARAAHRYPL